MLLLTNDGDWANKLAHPSHEIEKEYLVKIRGTLSADKIIQLTNGIKLDDGWTAPAKVVIIRTLDKTVWFTITIHEGRYRQVRRMCEALELPLVKLKRVRYGNILIGELKSGEYRLLDPAEVKILAGSGGGQGKAVINNSLEKPQTVLRNDRKKFLQRKPLHDKK